MQLAIEGGPHSIRANSISPGMFVTSTTASILERPDLLAAVHDKLMVGRPGKREDISWMAVYLASDESTFVTVADFKVDGGALAW